MDKHFTYLNVNLFNYVHNVYSGAIWLDEVMLCIISLMFRVSISLVSPHFLKVRNLLHKQASPDIVIVVNGANFHGTEPITQVTATKSKDPEKGICGHHLKMPRTVMKWGGTQNGMIAAQHEIHENSKEAAITEAQRALKIAEDLKNICERAFDRAEKLYELIDDIGITTNLMRRYKKYQIVEVERPRIQRRFVQTAPIHLNETDTPTNSRPSSPDSITPPNQVLQIRTPRNAPKKPPTAPARKLLTEVREAKETRKKPVPSPRRTVPKDPKIPQQPADHVEQQEEHQEEHEEEHEQAETTTSIAGIQTTAEIQDVQQDEPHDRKKPEEEDTVPATPAQDVREEIVQQKETTTSIAGIETTAEIQDVQQDEPHDREKPEEEDTVPATPAQDVREEIVQQKETTTSITGIETTEIKDKQQEEQILEEQQIPQDHSTQLHPIEQNQQEETDIDEESERLVDVTIDSDTFETFDFTSITPSALDTTEEKNKEETPPKQQEPTPPRTIPITPLRTSPQNIVTVHVVEATIHEEPSTTTKTTRQETATKTKPALQEKPSTSTSTSTSEKSTARSSKRKRTEAFSTLNDQQVEELFVDESSKERKTKKQIKDATYNRKRNIAGDCRKCGRKFTRLDNRDRHERDCGANNYYTCGQCGNVFTTKSSYSRHLNSHK